MKNLIVRLSLFLGLSAVLLTGSVTAQPIRATVGIIEAVSSVIVYDTDADAYFTAAGITDLTQKAAVNTLIVSLKGYGIWTKLYALYPFVGGTASAHKYNAKDPRDLDAAFRTVWSGTLTHNANGVTGGASGTGDTKFNSSASGWTTSNYSMGIFMKTYASSGGGEVFMGNTGVYFYQQSAAYYVYMPTVQLTATSLGAPYTGLLTTTRNGSTTYAYKNGSSVNVITGIGSLPSANLHILSYGGASYYCPQTTTGAFIGQYLSPTEVSDLATAFNAFNTALSR